MRGRRRVFCAVRGRARIALADGARPLGLGAGVLALVALAGCGGGSAQNSHEKSATYHMQIVAAHFPAKQAIARQTKMVLEVRNTGRTTVPDVAVTVDSFNYASNYPGLASDKRPIWVIEQGPGATPKLPVESQEVSLPGGGQTAYVNTWALGPLAAGRTTSFIWKVVPVKSGEHTVTYTVAAGLAGRAKAELKGGGAVTGRLTAQIASQPSATYVDPNTGKVVAGVYSSTPATP